MSGSMKQSPTDWYHPDGNLRLHVGGADDQAISPGIIQL